MTIELQLLAWSVALGLVHLTAAATAITNVRGTKWNMGARDEKVPELIGRPARLDRAFQNFKETFPFFVAAVVINEFTARTNGTQNSLSVVGAHLYFWSRAIYLPLYAFGIPGLRTLVWLASIVGILLVMSTALLSL